MNYSFICLRCNFLLLPLALLTGCSSLNKPASASFASVLISSSSSEDIQATTVKVFKEADYHTVYRSPGTDTLVFEKEGTQGQSLAYNGVVGTQAGEQILNRVRVSLTDRGDGSFWLTCQAFVVRDAGGQLGGDEIKLSNLRSRPYQKLLDEVARRLKNPKS